MADFRPMIAERLRSGPVWMNSLRAVKVQIARMIQDGEVELVKPEGGVARNMAALTEKGRKRYLLSNMKRKAITVPMEANEN